MSLRPGAATSASDGNDVLSAIGLASEPVARAPGEYALTPHFKTVDAVIVFR